MITLHLIKLGKTCIYEHFYAALNFTYSL